MVVLYTTTLNEIARPSVILLVITLFLALATYISYVYYSRKNTPIYIAKVNYDSYQNQAKSGDNQVVSNGALTVSNSNIGKIYSFASLDTCPKGQCSMKTTGQLAGAKQCPNDPNGIVMYNASEDVCIASSECTGDFPFAQKTNGEALGGDCGTGNDGCNCLAQPQCATQVVKYFNNTTGFSYNLEGSKEGGNFYNPLQLDANRLGKELCKINPAFVNVITNGCDLSNHWTDPIGCENFKDVTFNRSFILNIVVQDMGLVTKYFNNIGIPQARLTQASQNGNNLALLINGFQVSPPEELPNVGFLYNSDQSILIQYKGFSKSIITPTEHFYVINNVQYYDTNSSIKVFKSGSVGIVTGDSMSFNYFDYSFCNQSAVNGANNKSMLLCVQNENQPCPEGVLTYNFDRAVGTTNNSRNFCQAYDAPGVNRLDDSVIKSFYLTDPAYFTQSCVVGKGCGIDIDTELCLSGTDCSKAIEEKKNRHFPVFDVSAISNVWRVGPAYANTAFGPDITVNSTNYTLNNSLFDLENGDYFKLNNQPLNDIFMVKNASLYDTTIPLNTVNGLIVGSTLINPRIDGVEATITSIIENTITLSVPISENSLPFFTSGAQLLFFIPLSDQNYGVVRKLSSGSFNFLEIDNPTIPSNYITSDIINDNGVIFYKQFGFNGLNYGTVYDLENYKRIFSDSYKYSVTNTRINTIMKIAISPPYIVDCLTSSLVESDIDIFKQVFSSAGANYKQEMSMYYPVWNEDTFKQECVYCSPSLYSNPIVNSGGQISAIDIQFSGKDYSNYVKDFGSKLGSGGFIFTTYSKTIISTTKSSTYSVVLDEINPYISVGDYILDQDGIMPVSVYDHNNVLVSNPTSLQTFETKFSTNISTSIPTLLPDHLRNVKYRGSVIDAKIAGRYYYNSTNPSEFYYIVPKLTVSKILQNGKVLMLSGATSLNIIGGGTLLQIIKPTETLELQVEGDVGTLSKTASLDGKSFYSGSTASIAVDEITSGRITNISILNGGKNYVQTNKPLIFVSKFKLGGKITTI